MANRRRLLAALDGFVRTREGGARSKRHVLPLLEFAAAELRSRAVRAAAIQFEVALGRFYERQVDLIVRAHTQVLLTLLVVTQSGSVRKNLNNRRRDIVGDAVNLRAANPDSLVAVIYMLRADAEATSRGASGTSPIEEMAAFLLDLQSPSPPLGKPLLDAAALLSADRDVEGRILIEPMPSGVDVLGEFFDKLADGLKRRAVP